MLPNVAPTIAWTFEPSVLIGVAVLGTLYVLGWRRARASGSAHKPGYGRLAVFGLGLVVILAALVSPVDVLGDQLLFMHMVQHVLLLDIAPILLILGLTKVLTTLSWLIACGAVVFLWQRPSSLFFRSADG